MIDLKSQRHCHFYLNLLLTDTRSVFQEIQENSTWGSSSTAILQKGTEKSSCVHSYHEWSEQLSETFHEDLLCHSGKLQCPSRLSRLPICSISFLTAGYLFLAYLEDTTFIL